MPPPFREITIAEFAGLLETFLSLAQSIPCTCTTPGDLAMLTTADGLPSKGCGATTRK